MSSGPEAAATPSEVLGSTWFVPVREQVRKFAHAVEDETGWMVQRDGTEHVHPFFLSTYLWWPAGFYVREPGEIGHFGLFRSRFPELAQSPYLYSRVGFRLHASFPLGSRVRADVGLHSRYHKRGRDYIVLHAHFVNEEELTLADFKYTIALRPGPAAAAAMSQAAPDSSAPSRPPAADRGAPLLTRTVAMSLEKARLFHLPVEDHHTHDQLAQARGLPKATPSTTMALAYAAQMGDRYFGPDWIERGELEAVFLRSFLRDDVLTVSAWSAPAEGDQSPGRSLELALMDEQGHTVLAGRAWLAALPASDSLKSVQ